MPPNPLKLDIKIHPDPVLAPRYDATTKPLELIEAVITERGTEAGLPIVDLVLVDDQGQRYYAAKTGRLFLMLAAAIRGCNERNHGNPEP